MELKMKNMNCDLCSGYLATTYPTPASTPALHPTIVNFIKSGIGLREQMVFEYIFSDIGNENGFDYDFNNIYECGLKIFLLMDIIINLAI